MSETPIVTPEVLGASQIATKGTNALPVADDDIRPTVETVFKNIAAIAIIFSVSTAMATMTILFAYFAAFGNYSFLQMLQYSDLLQFALTTLPPFIVISFLLFGLPGAELKKRMSEPFSRVTVETVFATLVVLFIIAVFYSTLGDRSSTAGRYFLIASTIATLAVCLAIHLGRKTLRVRWLIPISLAGVAAFFALGFGFGRQDRLESGRGQYTITSKTEKLENVDILFMVSRGGMIYNRQTKVLMFIPDHEIQRVEYVVQP